MRFNIEKIILEGPDLSGKTSLYESLHSSTNYEWNIQDRSSLSMLCYAKQYNRSIEKHKRFFKKELTNLNNRVIILLPDEKTLLSRLRNRGDDKQDADSIINLKRIFEIEAEKVENLPNVLVIRDNLGIESLTNKVKEWLESSEDVNSFDIGTWLGEFALNSESKENTICFEFEGNIQKDFDKSILSDPKEGKYFSEIYQDFRHVIYKELLGLNEYGKPQTSQSRRFYYASRSCISSLHFKPRGTHLEFLCCLRSTNALENGVLDIPFLEFLVHTIGSEYFLECKDYRVAVNMNSAHLVDHID